VGAPPDVMERLTAMAASAKLETRPPGRHEQRDPELYTSSWVVVLLLVQSSQQHLI
jgi:hypothetical protein